MIPIATCTEELFLFFVSNPPPPPFFNKKLVQSCPCKFMCSCIKLKAQKSDQYRCPLSGSNSNHSFITEFFVLCRKISILRRPTSIKCRLLSPLFLCLILSQCTTSLWHLVRGIRLVLERTVGFNYRRFYQAHLILDTN